MVVDIDYVLAGVVLFIGPVHGRSAVRDTLDLQVGRELLLLWTFSQSEET